MAGIEGEKPAKSGIYWSCLVSFDAVDLPRAFYRPFQCIGPFLLTLSLASQRISMFSSRYLFINLYHVPNMIEHSVSLVSNVFSANIVFACRKFQCWNLSRGAGESDRS